MLQIAQIKNIITRLLLFVQEDFKNNQEDQTFLYKTFKGAKDGNFDFYEQGKKLFLRNETNPRNLRVLLEFPRIRLIYLLMLLENQVKEKVLLIQ